MTNEKWKSLCFDIFLRIISGILGGLIVFFLFYIFGYYD